MSINYKNAKHVHVAAVHVADIKKNQTAAIDAVIEALTTLKKSVSSNSDSGTVIGITVTPIIYEQARYARKADIEAAKLVMKYEVTAQCGALEE